MTIRTRSEAVAAAKGQTRNVPGTCQLTVRTWFNAPSAGDQDGDGDADAVDGWKSEPLSARHVGDRNPPRGVPLAFKGGSRGFGHRALSGTDGVFSTDMSSNRYRAGYTSKVTGTSTSDAIGKIERSMGVTYVGWSETIDGFAIPKETPVLVRPKRVPSEWNKMIHLDPSGYMNYHQAVLGLEQGQRIDIDAQHSLSGKGYGLHWGTVGKNHLHDPKKLIRSTRRIDSLTDDEIRRLRGPNGEQVFGIVHLLREVREQRASAEVELKVEFATATIKRWLQVTEIKELNAKDKLVFKTLASMSGPAKRLKPAHDAGGTTLLSFTKYDGAGIYKVNAWPVTDYTRGTPKWR